MPNEFNIKNGFISQGNSTVNGSLTANTISTTTLRVTSGATAGYVLTSIDTNGNTTWSSPSTLTGLTTSDFYVTGGTFSNNTLTLNRQNGSVTITGLTSVINSLVDITDPFYTEPSSTTINWDVSGTSTNYTTTLTASTTINLTNVRNGEYGTIILKQDAVGSQTITLGTLNGSATTHKVVNGGSLTLTSTANAIDMLSFVYDGSVVYWNKGLNYV